MTYQIYYSKEEYLRDGTPISGRGYTMFDIEYYLKQSDEDKNLWLSEIHCLPRVEGLARYLKDNLTNKEFNLEQFIKDAEEIQGIRGRLYEFNKNFPREKKLACDFHYNHFKLGIEDLIESFVNCYDNLYLNID